MKLVVIGAGVAGLAAGMQLASKHEVAILEKLDYLGGLAASYKVKWADGQETWIPRNYHHILEDDIFTKETIKYCGLWNDFYTRKISYAFYANGKFMKLSNPVGVFEFPAFGCEVYGRRASGLWLPRPASL